MFLVQAQEQSKHFVNIYFHFLHPHSQEYYANTVKVIRIILTENEGENKI